MRTLQRAFLAATLAFLCASAAWGQAQNESFSAAPGGGYDPSVCQDPQIAIEAKQQNATPYHDPNWNTPGDPLPAALGYLAQKYDNNNINRAGACEHGPGVVFMVPNNLVGEVTQLIGEIEAAQSKNETFSASANKDSSGGPDGTPTNGGPPGNQPSGVNGGPLSSSASANPCEPNYDMSTAAGRAAAVQMAAQTQAACCMYRKAHNPDLDCGNTVVQTPPTATVKKTAVPDDTACLRVAMGLAWDAQQTPVVQTSINNAKAMLLKAKATVTTWSPATQNLSIKWFGDDGTKTQTIAKAEMLKRINGELGQIATMNVANNTQPAEDPEKSPFWDVFAFVHPSDRNLLIYICPEFFNIPATGADSQAATIIHELSHEAPGGSTGDATYGDVLCQILALVASKANPAGATVAGQVAKAAGTVGAPTAVTGAFNAQHDLSQAAFSNAASFQYFIFDASR